MSGDQETDHRKRVGADRRAKTRQRLIESAMPVFAQKGVGASAIDDVIATAGVSRGTFYNYFQSNRELLLAVNDQLRDEFIALVHDAVGDFEDPAERIAASIGLMIQFARSNPLLASFITQVGLEAAGPERLISGYMARQIRQGIDQGRFVDGPLNVALDMVAGATLFAFLRVSLGEASDSHGSHVVTAILRGLGLSPDEAAQIAQKPLPEMDITAACSLVQSTINAKSSIDQD
ncbi:TetR family transcriptional regulator [Pacificibacter maritimus]|uniref:TetR family transcriptional regulator n=1 Tax=Pacificibacter maritimus TaxID=762213 RepID=A0A3N4UH03_9RHOB|nr:TetR/AcrR family transcriptional regulator [Pacificibacter maritimus]RPE66531.1 TetR family transcriptional regulator [Pacificibacter maritimus]